MKAAAFESRAAPEALPGWRREIDQCQATIQQFLTETLTELHDVIEILGRSASASDSGTVQSLGLTAAAKPQRELRGEGIGSELPQRVDTGSGEKDAVAVFPPMEASGAETFDDRLAQLARRLEEKLERSSSRANEKR